MLLEAKIIEKLYAKEEDTGNHLRLQLYKDGESFNLLGEYNSSQVRVVLSNGKCLVANGEPWGIDFVNGIITVRVDNIGDGFFKGEIIIDNGEEHLTFPNNGYFSFKVLPNIENMPFQTVSKELYDQVVAELNELKNA